jgi:FixJ family two-component response regulator
MGSILPLIAIVDDDDGVRRSLRRLLSSLSYEPVVFASGEEFLESISKIGRPGCVLMDLHLPGLNGFEILERIRQGRDPLPVVIMTGFDEPGTRERCIAAGAVAYITKPVEVALLSSVIGGALQSN